MQPLWILLLAACVSAAEVERSPRDRAELHERIVPVAVEAWETIPWRLDLLAARSEAERLGKPLFLWSMNGHPLGCT